MNTYIAELHRLTGTNTYNGFIARLAIESENRSRAVHKAQFWYWAKYHGRRLRKRKYRDIRLAARTMPAAVEEIEGRNLLALHKHSPRRLMRVRLLTHLHTLVAHGGKNV